MRRVLVVTSGLVVLALAALAVFAWVTVRSSFPDTTGQVRLDGLEGEVEIRRDGQGIPQIYADTAPDLFFAQGWVHAQDRFFEMDFRRHVTSGRLAELFGETAADTDEFVRTLGWRRVAEAELELLDEETVRLLEAYASGVNAYIEGKSGSGLSLEYTVLALSGTDYRPEPWTPADSVAWVKAMAWDLRSNMDDEIGRVEALTRLEPEQVDELWPAYPDAHHTIVGDGLNVYDGVFGQDPCTPDDFCQPLEPGLAQSAVASLSRAASAAEAVPALLGTGDGVGSNSWVVAGKRSVTGSPLLANDPHLAPSMPGIWYQVGLHCRELGDACPYDVSGFSFSGMPGVVVGHTREIAWGVTTMYADVADLYLEQVDDVTDTYLYDGEQVPLEVRHERIKVRGGLDRVIAVRSTRHGPILSDLDDDIAGVGRRGGPNGPDGPYAVALRWTALDPSPTVDAVFALGRTRTVGDFRAAAEKFDVPSQNLVYAHADGTIGYQAPGRIPLRGRGDGRWPVPGWDPAYEWQGMIPFTALPHVEDPAEGFIVTANNKVIGSQYPLQLGADTAAGYRSQRIREQIETRDVHSVEDLTGLQLDTHNANAERLVPALLAVDVGSLYYREGQQTLRGWDFTQPADSAAAAYFNATWRHLLALTFHDDLPQSQWPDGGERWFNVIDRILDDPESPWWDDRRTSGVIETRADILIKAQRLARDELTSRLSRDPDKWRWGRLHRLTLVNATLGESGIGIVESLFNRGPYELGGGGGIVNATAWNATEGYEVVAVPSMRMVVDLADLDASRWIQLTGSSGHAFHRNYTDQTELWAQGRTLPWSFSREAVEESATDVLTLVPRSG